MAEKEQAAQEHARNMERQILEYQQQQTQMMQQMQQQQQMMQQQQAQMSWLMSQTALSTPPGSLPPPPLLHVDAATAHSDPGDTYHRQQHEHHPEHEPR